MTYIVAEARTNSKSSRFTRPSDVRLACTNPRD